MKRLTKNEQARVDRAMQGEYLPSPTEAEKAEIERRWFAAGRSNKDLGRIQGWTRKVEPKMWKAPKTQKPAEDGNLDLGLMPGDWAREGACVGDDWLDAWHPGENAQEATYAAAYALRVCATCPVRLRCLQFALEAGPRHAMGIWGNTTGEQRRKLAQRAA